VVYLRVLAIPGTANPDHLAENVAAAALRLSEDEMTAFEPGRPGNRDQG
jgi:diketogulonate reductase-like aldo/keto reductase